MPSDNDIITKKTYLGKVKVADDYDAEDKVWAICNAGKDNIDHEDFKNLVEMNGMGLWTPILSKDVTTLGSLKNSALLKAAKVIGNPTLLFERIHTFKELAIFCYKKGIFKNPKGKEMLDKKIAESKLKNKTASRSTTLEEASETREVQKQPRISAFLKLCYIHA